MYVKIWKDSGKTYLNEHELKYREGHYYIGKKRFDRMGQAACYVATLDNLPKPENLILSTKINIKEEPEDIAQWVSIRTLKKQYNLDRYHMRLFRNEWSTKHPADVISNNSGAAYRLTDELTNYLEALFLETSTGRPAGCPKNYVGIKELAKEKGVCRDVIGSYVAKMRKQDVYYATFLKTKIWVNPNYKLVRK